jgi:DNA repair protein RadC
VLLSSRNVVLGIETISIGSLNASIVHPREVFKPAILCSAASIALAHNHPSGDAEPSNEDIAITRRMIEAARLLGIELLDHVIVASRGTVSFRTRELL